MSYIPSSFCHGLETPSYQEQQLHASPPTHLPTINLAPPVTDIFIFPPPSPLLAQPSNSPECIPNAPFEFQESPHSIAQYFSTFGILVFTFQKCLILFQFLPLAFSPFILQLIPANYCFCCTSSASSNNFLQLLRTNVQLSRAVLASSNVWSSSGKPTPRLHIC